MPVYDYDCAACGRRFEVIHGVHADQPTTCPLCGKGPVRKAISAAAVHYRGSGWAKKERRSSAASGAPKDGADSAAGGEGSAKGDGKSDAKSDAKSDGSGKSDGAKRDRAADGSKDTAAGTPAAKPAEAGAAKTTD